MRPALFLCLLALLHTGAAEAECECLWHGSFSEVEAHTDLVISATVIHRNGNSIDLRVDQLLRGPKADGPVRIWLKAADYCRPDAVLFPIDSQWVMALHQITDEVEGGFNPNTPGISYGRIGDYSLSSCGGYRLQQSGNRVTGNLINAHRWDHNPPMSPVLLDLITEFVAGRINSDALLQASKENPKLRELILDTRSFLRKEN